jgi:DNA-binding response OmpR family regulator
MLKPRILLVDDDESIRVTLVAVLSRNNFDVTPAASVTEALHHISTSKFDGLLSDLHMPNPGDGLTVVSAMRHSNPDAVTMLLSSFPAMDAAAQAIILHVDEILIKPMKVEALVASIRRRLATGPPAIRVVESVAAILQRATQTTIDDWYSRIETDPQIMAIKISRAQRCAHLPQLFRDLHQRLLAAKSLGTRELRSPSAEYHGAMRRRQGYTAAMMVEESRELQVSIFQTLQNNLDSIDFSILLISVMTIADEVDSQLSQAMKCYISEFSDEAEPVAEPAA